MGQEKKYDVIMKINHQFSRDYDVHSPIKVRSGVLVMCESMDSVCSESDSRVMKVGYIGHDGRIVEYKLPRGHYQQLSLFKLVPGEFKGTISDFNPGTSAIIPVYANLLNAQEQAQEDFREAMGLADDN